MIKVEGQNILPKELEAKLKKAQEMERQGYSTDKILYVMSEENRSEERRVGKEC